MIIAFYPGAGGNRYLRMLKNQDWSDFHKSYDIKVNNQDFKNRYLLAPKLVTNDYTLTHDMNAVRINSFFPTVPIIFIVGDLQKCLRREWILEGHARYKKKQIERIFNRVKHYTSYKDEWWPSITTIDELELLPKNILAEVNLDFKRVMENTPSVVNTLQSVTDELIASAESSYEIINWHLEYYRTYPVNFSKNCHLIINIDTDDTQFAEVMRSELDLYHSEVFDKIWSLANEQS